MSETLLLLLRLNLAAAAAVGVVMLLRAPVRRLFGAGCAYALWVLPPLAMLAMILPGRVVTHVRAPVAPASAGVWTQGPQAAAAPLPPGVDLAAGLAGLWLAGGLAGLAWIAWRQLRFARAVRQGRGGPAVIGVLRPRIVTPADFARRYTEREQLVVLAHEATHIARHDSRINAAVALSRCALWFNPAIHVLAHFLRLDQELACDAAVVARHPTARRAYAQALLKTQLAGHALPLGCHWPAQGAHPLAQRIGLLAAAPRWPARLGAAAVASLALALGWTAWAARPAQVVFAAAPAQAAPSALAVGATESPPVPSKPTRPRAPPRPARLAVADPPPVPAPPAPASDSEAQPAGEPPWGDRLRLMPVGLFGPPRRVPTIADLSYVEPGLAIRVIATMTDPDGIPLTTDLTAFGSQSRYRIGYIERGPSRYKLFTRVVQHGQRLTVTAGLDKSFTSLVTGSVDLASGETGTIRLPGGQLITVTPILRPETPMEMVEVRGRPRVDIRRVANL